MTPNKQMNTLKLIDNLPLLANSIIEGFINGIHKSPFHGFSSEFLEHKLYNQGDSTKHIDWKRYAKSDKLFIKKYEEDTNMRCHFIIDNSSSMHYPRASENVYPKLNKIGISVLAASVLLTILKKQRDAFGLSVYSDKYDFYAMDKGNEAHYQKLLTVLSQLLEPSLKEKSTKTHKYLLQIAEKIHRRSMIVLFTDMFSDTSDNEKILEALRKLKYYKHQVIVFHIIDNKTEKHLDFGDAPSKFVDVESGKTIDVFSSEMKEKYLDMVNAYFQAIKSTCLQYKIHYKRVDISDNLTNVLSLFLRERQKFA